MKITYKLMLGAAIPAILIWVVGFYASTISQASLYNSIERASVVRARAVMDEIDRVMHTRVAEWMAYSRAALVQQALKQSNRDFEQLEDAQRYIDEHDKEWRAQAKGVQTDLMQRLLNNELAQDLRTHLEQLGKSNEFPVYGEVFITNRFGANMAQTHRTSDYRQDDEDWWQLAVQKGIYVSDVEFDESAEVFSTNICLRINDDGGNLVGVLKAVLNIQEAMRIIDQRALNPLTGDRDRLALFTASKRIIHTSFSQAPPLSDGSSYFGNIDVLTKSVMTLNRMDQKSGEKRLSVFARSTGHAGFHGLGWTLLVEHTADKIFQPAYQLRKNIFLIALAATLLTVLLGGGFVISLARRINNLTQVTRDLGHGNLEARVKIRGRDGLTLLAESFNRMASDLSQANGDLHQQAKSLEKKNRLLLDEIDQRQRAEYKQEALQKQLIDSSRQAGMAEIATGVLHNVGNVLNSVNAAATLALEQIRQSQVDGLAKAVTLMDAHADDLGTFITGDERGQHLPSFLRQLAQHLLDERAATLEHLEAVTDKVDHIKEIVSMQQAYATAGGTVEPLSLATLMDDALKTQNASFYKHEVALVKEYAKLPLISTDRHKMIQILVNLIGNAKYALTVTDSAHKQLTLRIGAGDADWVYLEVVDNGCGIAIADLTRVFQHGFTTKKEGHGFGLHSCSLAAKELGGSLTAHSDGPGQGARFRLELPIKGTVSCTL